MEPALSKEEIIDGHNLTFDPGDKPVIAQSPPVKEDPDRPSSLG